MLMANWRVTRKLSLRGVAARLTELHGPTPGGGPAGSEGTIQGILANPKYTGRIVLGRRTNASDSRRKGEQRIVQLPREYWTWASDTNAHEAIIDLATWEAAQAVGRERGNVRDPGTPLAGRQTRRYACRSRMTCRQCGKRMHGLPSGLANGPDRIYSVFPTKASRPVDALRHPDQVPASVREEVLTAALSDFLDTYALAPGRAGHLAELLPATQAGQDELDQARADAVRKRYGRRKRA
jgi:Recombinase